MIFPLPFDAETAPYTLKNRQKHFPVPGFRKADKAVFFAQKTKWDRWELLQFPLPENYSAVNDYRLILEKKTDNGSYAHYGLVDLVNNGDDSSSMVNFEFGAGYLAQGTYRFTLTPVNYFRCSGSPLKGVFSVKKVPWQVVKKDPVPTIYTQKKGGVERSEMLNFSNSRCGGPDIGTACFYLSRLTISFAAASTSSAERPVL